MPTARPADGNIYYAAYAFAGASQSSNCKPLLLPILSLPSPLFDPTCKNNVDIEKGIAEDAAFIGCPVFAGKMDGYEFKTDVQVRVWHSPPRPTYPRHQEHTRAWRTEKTYGLT